jgi:hypothetical protein
MLIHFKRFVRGYCEELHRIKQLRHSLNNDNSMEEIQQSIIKSLLNGHIQITIRNLQ